MCKGCRRKSEEHEASPWLMHIWDLYVWQEGGWIFKPNDLTPPEWKALGEYRILRKELEGKKHG